MLLKDITLAMSAEEHGTTRKLYRTLVWPYSATV